MPERRARKRAWILAIIGALFHRIIFCGRTPPYKTNSWILGNHLLPAIRKSNANKQILLRRGVPDQIRPICQGLDQKSLVTQSRHTRWYQRNLREIHHSARILLKVGATRWDRLRINSLVIDAAPYHSGRRLTIGRGRFLPSKELAESSSLSSKQPFAQTKPRSKNGQLRIGRI